MLNAEQHSYRLLQEKAPSICERYDSTALFMARVEKWKKLISETPQLKHQISSLRKQSLALILQEHEFTEDEAMAISNDAFECFMHWRHQPQYFDHVIETLESLKQEYQLAAITNGNACSKRLGLDKYFSLHVSAEDLGIGKPEAQPFMHTLKHFNLPAQECLHIGDHPDDDVWGAQQLGFHTLWFNRKEEQWAHTHFQASGEVRSWEKIPAAVKQLQET